MEKYNLGDRLLSLVKNYLTESGLKINRGTLVDATVINPLASTKNKKRSLTWTCIKQEREIRGVLE